MHETSIDENRARSRPSRGGGNSHRKLRLLNRNELDGRTTAAKTFDAIARAISRDLGGEDQLSTVQKHLVEAFAGIALHVGDCNARLLLGELVDITEHSQAASTMVRLAQRIGLQRQGARNRNLRGRGRRVPRWCVHERGCGSAPRVSFIARGGPLGR
jgi:hypothetical protein